MPKVPRAKFLGSDRLFCFNSICKFGSFKNPFATITRLFELSFRLRFILLVQTKKVISTNSSTSSWKPWSWVILTWYLQWEIYINSSLKQLTKFTSSRSTGFKDIFPWEISHMIVKTILMSTRIFISYKMNRVIPFRCLMESQWKLTQQHEDNNMIRISQWRKNHCRTNTGTKI